MRFELIMEDTTKGVQTSIKAKHNGVTDNGKSSLSAHLVAFLESHMSKMGELKVLVVKEAANE